MLSDRTLQKRFGAESERHQSGMFRVILAGGFDPFLSIMGRALTRVDSILDPQTILFGRNRAWSSVVMEAVIERLNEGDSIRIEKPEPASSAIDITPRDDTGETRHEGSCDG